ncbi:SNF2 family N-terminal domain-containing protein [Talaromyces proteolyticus]|uniref:SNF2 family N-terminal domain-containing protein n=1 Tax=Talaromyces proteolyticus TaxID=1131652 RepID=A0AAD4PTA8_9EURO|nr:SNF2 family N-terminal domain-containing protein [Talaromyces proteolyticus]KAH8690546.1 SNF2 family N-terminal domain-containing protein [Talaromyces proteolyticus]
MDYRRAKRGICDTDDVSEKSPVSKRLEHPKTACSAQFSTFEHTPRTNSSWTFSPYWLSGTDDNEINTPLTSEAYSDLNGDAKRYPDAMALLFEEEMQCDTAESEEICFGMLCEVKVRLKDDPRIFVGTDRFVHNPADNDKSHQLQMIHRDNHIAVQYTPEVDMAVVNSNVTKAIRALNHLNGLRYEVLASAVELSGAISSWVSKGKTTDFYVEIIIYGPRGYYDEIGTILSKFRLFLQLPRYRSDDIPYENPHVWKLDCLPSPVLPLLSTDPMPDHAANPITEANAILNALDQSDFLDLAVIDERIIKELLSHQRTGVDFIAQREGWRPSCFFSLWEPRKKGLMKFYEHKITGTRNSCEPRETIGGILADEMGLGKTLTVLSAIVGSMELAASSNSVDLQSGIPFKPHGFKVKATLVIVPSVLLIDEWMREIREHVATDFLRVLRYHGSSRGGDDVDFSNYDIVISTYATIATEFGRGASQIHSVQWFRVVLDEAHYIRHQNTRQYRAMSALSASFRWCLTGTPIQNSLEDLGALVRFLRVPLLDANDTLRQQVLRPAEAGKAIGFTNLQSLLKSICLRRTKELLNLDEPEVTRCELALSSQEKTQYDRIINDSRQEIDIAVSDGRSGEAYRGIFKVILKLRLLCTYGTFYTLWQKAEGDDSNNPEEEFFLLQQSDQAMCRLCSCDIASINDPSDPNSGTFTSCFHLLCNDCHVQYKEEMPKKKKGRMQLCTICQEMGQKACSVKRQPKKHREQLSLDYINQGHSTKLSKLVDNISQHNMSDKAIVFSAWKGTLRIIAGLLAARFIPVLQIDGSLSIKERQKVLTRFQQDAQRNVLLMTLGTGAVGLNLTVANRIHLVEPQWNPSVENQAIGRVLRLGQQRKVYVIRYIVENSIENYVQSKQSKKIKLAEVGWSGESQDLQNVLKLRSVLDYQ